MSHKPLHSSSNSYVYVREFKGHCKIWFEDAVGDLRARIDFEEWELGSWEADFPLQSYPMEEFKKMKIIVEQYLKSRGVKEIWGFTNNRLGAFLILSDRRFKWKDDIVQVGNNQKRKIVWTF